MGKLSNKYKFKGNFDGKVIQGWDGPGIDSDWYVLWCNNNRTSLRLTIKVSREALYLRLFGPLGFLRPTLLIPWREISEEVYDPTVFGFNIFKAIGMTGVKTEQILLNFTCLPEVKLQIPQFIMKKMHDAKIGLTQD